MGIIASCRRRGVAGFIDVTAVDTCPRVSSMDEGVSGMRFRAGVDIAGAASEAAVSKGAGDFDVKTLKMIGFKALLAWHYLVLFSPLFMGAWAQSSDFLFMRQMVLYLSLSASFGILTLVGRPLLKRSKSLGPSRVVIVTVGGCVHVGDRAAAPRPRRW